MDKNELLARLQRFALENMGISDLQTQSKATQNLLDQLSRSATSPALNYAEALGAIGVKDFVNKLSICVKELRETQACLVLLQERLGKDSDIEFASIIQECNELTAILVSSINTVQKRYNLTGRY